MTRLTKVASHWDVSIKLATALRLKGAWPLLSKDDQLHALATTRDSVLHSVNQLLKSGKARIVTGGKGRQGENDLIINLGNDNDT